jgi:hypothetical protein
MSVNRLAATASIAAVLLAVLAGLYLAGSPAGQRALRLDQLREADLRQLQGIIQDYWEATGRLPGDLAELVDGRRLTAVPADPESGEAYEYERPGETAFRLCARFSAGSPADSDFWSHAAGRQCFGFDMDPTGRDGPP